MAIEDIVMLRSMTAATLALAVGLGVAACGGSSKSSSTTHTSTAAVTSTPTSSSTSTSSTTTSAHKAASHKAPKKKASHTSTTTSTSTTTTHTTTTPHKKPHHPKPSGLVGPIQASFVGANHSPTAGHLWFYTVTARDAHGKPLSGTVDTEFVFNGTVVGHETPPTHPLTDGRLHDGVTFPADSIGYPLEVRVVIHTQIGTVTLDWSVRVHK